MKIATNLVAIFFVFKNNIEYRHGNDSNGKDC